VLELEIVEETLVAHPCDLGVRVAVGTEPPAVHRHPAQDRFGGACPVVDVPCRRRGVEDEESCEAVPCSIDQDVDGLPHLILGVRLDRRPTEGERVEARSQ